MSETTTIHGGADESHEILDDWSVRDLAWSGIRSERISVHGHPVGVLRHDARGDGPPQLLIHGLGSSSRSWLDVIRPLSRHGEVVAVDLPGFGSTPIPSGGSARIRANTHFVRALLDALGWERAAIFGNSMGGLIATLAAGWFPERTERLVLLNPALPAPRRHMLRVSKRVWTRILPAATPGLGRLAVEYGLRSKTAEEIVQDSLAGALHDAEVVRPSLREVLAESTELVLEEPWRRSAIVDAARSLVAMHVERREVAEAVRAVRAPTLVVWGDEDQLVSRATIDGLLAQRDNWTRHDFERIGHAPQLECPTALVEVVERFYEDARGR